MYIYCVCNFSIYRHQIATLLLPVTFCLKIWNKIQLCKQFQWHEPQYQTSVFTLWPDVSPWYNNITRSSNAATYYLLLSYYCCCIYYYYTRYPGFQWKKIWHLLNLTLTVKCNSSQVNVHRVQHVLQNCHNTSMELAQVILKNTGFSCLY
jgi:hypothetical protein